ncbi:MAG TPA: TlpA disulfide reductase family protein [Noviherbaspirillum sp.]|uniref:TlpA family protein disulfide reductase n=1 Tax=Noviherbaspirillum sp. TaxID=1926288 RepID=UPI002D23D1EB|nr:TlpA disulfide reductase family protein [Noviherbaspirillum sp.]HYD93859.1 TlpA disulfide reductase family protein [Noviherbaspirillum sp.]
MMKKIAAVAALLALPVLAAAADFSFTDTTGKTHTMSSHPGKWVLVNLWATWCAPCLAEMPELEALSKARRSDLVVLGLAVDGQAAPRVARFAEKLGVSYPVIAGNAAMAQQFGPKGYPTSILYNASGQQVFVKEGPVTRQEIEGILNRGKP